MIMPPGELHDARPACTPARLAQAATVEAGAVRAGETFAGSDSLRLASV